MLFYKGKSFNKVHCTTRASKHTKKTFHFSESPPEPSKLYMYFPKFQIFPNCSSDNFFKWKKTIPFFFIQLRKTAYRGTCLDQGLIDFSTAIKRARDLVLCDRLPAIWCWNTRFGSKSFSK